jgi:hypothetical protein
VKRPLRAVRRGPSLWGHTPVSTPVSAEPLSQARARATELVVGHWSAIERLADLLVDEWKLEGDRLVRLIEAALDNAPDIIAAATEALEREASEKAARKREDVFVVERRLDFERRAAALRARGETGDAALAAAWQEAGDRRGSCCGEERRHRLCPHIPAVLRSS